ncbi:MAG: UDP-N-acetylmuramoyl-L-alanyl-D-glutamate--2,6-diaminopimelate ligase [Verrucomicrobia bacterium]|nr:UDP-N-acetylmuramoyl-L-alanyl-D-glutamate--2,6-diaminopimelate ligase [Verrucomicrobiota bacterium]
MLPNLQSLFPESLRLNHVGNLKQPVSALVIDSRRVIPGAVFFAIPGLRTNGRYFVEEAIDRGAVAVVSESDQVYPQITTIQVENIRKVVAQVARCFYDSPDETLELIGITGTNGKTTVSYLIQSLLNGAAPSARTGLIGTVQYDLGHRTLPSYKTTPEAIDTFALLKQMKDAGCQRGVMEVSSHGIDQNRTYGALFDVVVFLNLTRDHLDYHHDMENYFRVKQRLFTGGIGGLPKVAVVNLDDPYGKRLIDEMEEGIRLVTFSLSDNSADLHLLDYECDHSGSQFTVKWSGGSKMVRTRLPGQYNLSNILAALSVCEGLGLELKTVFPHLETFEGVPGRMERIEEALGFDVFVDYAHTDDALDKALEMLRKITRGKLIVTFGCGGNRDRDKRKSMMEVAQKHADFVCATSDNPRGESVEAILEDMKEGVTEPEKVEFIADRRAAISRVLDVAQPGDTVLIAGKGHETMQEFKDRIVPFDDRNVARDLLEIKQLVKHREK